MDYAAWDSVPGGSPSECSRRYSVLRCAEGTVFAITGSEYGGLRLLPQHRGVL